MRTAAWVRKAVVAGWATVAVWGCGPAQPDPVEPAGTGTVADPAPADPAPADPAPTDPAPVGPVADPTPPAGPDAAAMQALLEAQCVRCHGMDKIDAERADRGEWTAIIDRMIGLGVSLTETERGDLIEYLAARPAA